MIMDTFRSVYFRHYAFEILDLGAYDDPYEQVVSVIIHFQIDTLVGSICVNPPAVISESRIEVRSREHIDSPTSD